MNIPIMMDVSELEDIRNDLDRLIKCFQEINKIGTEKQEKVKELVGEEMGSKIMNILFKEIVYP